MATTAERIQLALNLRNMKQSDLVYLTGIGKSSISTYLKGEYEPKQRNIYKIAKALDVNEAWLIGEDVPMERRVSSYDPADIAAGYVQMPKANTVPLLGRIACGEGIYADQNIEEYVPAPAHCKADFALRCQGDSMTGARIFDGDIVYIRHQPDVDNGDIGAVLIGEEATLKKVYRTPDKLVLRAENPLYADRVFTDEALAEVSILGKAVCFLSTVQHEVDRIDGEWRRYVGQPVAARGGGVRPMTEAQAKSAWKYEQNRIKTGK